MFKKHIKKMIQFILRSNFYCDVVTAFAGYSVSFDYLIPFGKETNNRIVTRRIHMNNDKGRIGNPQLHFVDNERVGFNYAVILQFFDSISYGLSGHMNTFP